MGTASDVFASNLAIQEADLSRPVSRGSRRATVGFAVTTLPIVPEVTTDNNELKDAQPFTVPVSLSGQIETPSDIDNYIFEAKKDEKYSFEIISRRAGCRNRRPAPVRRAERFLTWLSRGP